MKKPTKKTTVTKPVTLAPIATSTTSAPKAPVVAQPAATLPPAALVAPTAPAVSAGPVKSAVPATPPTITAVTPITIEAKIDIGFGNNLFVRGQGEGLSWERGVPLENVDAKTWRLTVPAKDKVQFKILLNDAVWCKGEDFVATPGKKVEVTPAF